MLCETSTGWRLMFDDLEQSGWQAVPCANHSLSPEDSPTLTEWLKALNDGVDNGTIEVTESGIDRERPPPEDDWTYFDYPWNSHL